MIGCAPRWLLLLIFLGFIPGLVQHQPETGVFTADTVTIPAGGCVTLSWNYPDAVSAELRGSNWPTGSVDFVEATGSTQVCPSAALNYVPTEPVDYTLTVYYTDGRTSSSMITIYYQNDPPTDPYTHTPPPLHPVPTSTPYKMSTTIPVTATPVTLITAIYQPFEYGFMLQILGQGCAYAFSTQANAIIIPRIISQKEGGVYQYCLPIPDAPITGSAPQGLLLPEGSLGHGWAGYAEIQAGLGYATAPQIIYTGVSPRDDPVTEGLIYYVGIMTLPDGRGLRCGNRGATAGTCQLID